jgi:hypothetical protein
MDVPGLEARRDEVLYATAQALTCSFGRISSNNAGVAASAREMVMANGDGMGWGEPRRRSIE